MQKKNITVRLDENTLKRLDRVAERLARPGIEMTRAVTLRAAIRQGLDRLEAELVMKGRAR